MSEKALARISEAERRIAEAKTPQEANVLRRQIGAIQKLLGKRKEEHGIAFDAATAYLKACVKAGELWKATENKKRRGGIGGSGSNVSDLTLVSAEDAGFTSREDARVCVRLAEAQDDLDTYLEDCEQQIPPAIPSPTGMTFYSVWKKYVTGSGDVTVEDVPAGRFRCLVIDPPWPVAKIERDVRPNQDAALDYGTWTVEDIQSGKLKAVVADKADEKAHLYLWTTHKYLPTAIECAREWGFEYQCLMTWVKNVGMTPYSWMYSTEHVVFATRGGLALKRMGIRLDFSAKVREHSRKPDEFYDIVKEASPGPRIDMFSREKRDGFAQWGNEAAKFSEDAA